MTTDLLLALAINRLPFVRANEKTMLFNVVDTPEFYRSLDRDAIADIVGRSPRPGPDGLQPVFADETLRVAERDFEFCRRRDIRIIPIWDNRYPPALREIFDPPFMIFVRGRLPDPGLPCIAVVGTREPSAAAVRAARSLCRELAGAGFWTISGLARGIDASSHRGALLATGAEAGRTGAVLGCGIDRVTPSSNRSLAAEMLRRGGFLMSEYSPGVSSAKYHYPARNRIISGLCRGVVVVEAPGRSGALITADYALDHGRDLFVHASGIQDVVGAGARELAEDGARIIERAADILDEWGVGRQAAVADPDAGTVTVPGSAADAAALLANELRSELALERTDAR